MVSAKKLFSAAASAAGAGADAAKKATFKKLGDALGNSNGVIDDSVKKLVKNADGSLNDEAFQALGATLRKAGRNEKTVAKNLKAVTELVKDAPTSKIAKATGSSLAETADAMKKADTFFKKNQTALVAAGIGALGLGAYMLLTGESNPARALGKLVGEGLGAAGKGLADGLGISDFFKKWGMYIAGFVGLIVLIIIGSMFF